MVAGLESYTDTGIIQLSQDIHGLRLISMGLASIHSGYTYGAVGSCTIQVPSSVTVPLVATRHASGVAPLSRVWNGSSWDHRFNTGASGGEVGYYIFDISSIEGTSTTFGLEVYDANGMLTYSSARGSASVYAVLNGSVAGGGQSVGLVSGRRYATVVPRFAGYRDNYFVPADEGGPRYDQLSDMWGGAVSHAGGTASAAWVPLASATNVASATDYEVAMTGMLVLDVTAYGAIANEQYPNNG